MTTFPEALPDQTRRWNPEALRSSLGGSRLRYTLCLYLASRVLFFVIAAVHGVTQHQSLSVEMGNWDGVWYLRTSQIWYGTQVPVRFEDYRDLGFMPLYPMLIWLVSHATYIGNFGAGLLIALVSGGIATVLISNMVEQWWGEQAARRAILFWCFFPGTIVFSMIYTEGLTLALATGCMVLLLRKRWLYAGICAGFATAIAPVAFSLIVICAVASWQELRARGWRDSQARRSLIAPILSPLGAIGFGIYLWIHVGSPFADFTAQRVGWDEHSTPLEIPKIFGSLIRQIFISGVGQRHGPGGIDLNGILALLGTAFLFWGGWLLWRNRERVPLIVLVWTGCIAFLTLISGKTPPNPRMLVVAFPVVLAVGAQFSGRAFKRLMVVNVFSTLVMSYLTYVGLWLRP